MDAKAIRKAAAAIRRRLDPTPLIRSSSFTDALGFECLLKLENIQKTGSFKSRGALYRLTCLTRAERARGVVAASSGNHAQGVAWAASLLGIKSLIVMPETAPIAKQAATRGYGAEVLTHGSSFGESYGLARRLARELGLVFIAPFDDPLIIAGQGTIGLEIIAARPDVDAIVVPVGGGGLISGIALAVKSAKRGIKVVGVEAKASPSCSRSLKKGGPAAVEPRATIADGIAVKSVGEITYPIIEKYVDDVVSVGDEAIAAAIVQFVERKKLVVEGAGAVTLAAALEGRLPAGIKKGVLVVSGGNIDVTTLDRVLRSGLMRQGRVMKAAVLLRDAPGELARFTSLIASLKANILHILHKRDASDAPVGTAAIEVILEVEGPAHARRVIRELKDRGYGE